MNVLNRGKEKKFKKNGREGEFKYFFGHGPCSVLPPADEMTAF